MKMSLLDLSTRAGARCMHNLVKPHEKAFNLSLRQNLCTVKYDAKHCQDVRAETSDSSRSYTCVVSAHVRLGGDAVRGLAPKAKAYLLGQHSHRGTQTFECHGAQQFACLTS